MGLLLFGIISYIGVIVWMAGGAGNHTQYQYSGSGPNTRSGRNLFSKKNLFPFILFGGILLYLYIKRYNCNEIEDC